ncbi:MAG: UDP-N-acetylmuramyl-tripeptide synthetase [Patescibacteria group bacterium]|nr:UDP-N-acetylmuramyl-tripeptide synthetase [Patescibacteria group bacterium]
MKKILRTIIPFGWQRALRPFYHGFLATCAHWYYGRPGEQMVVIGITGTAGKSTTIHLLAHILNRSGIKTGYITTVDFFDGQNSFINKHGLSMPNEMLLQRELRAMARNACRVAIVESTSEGLAQNRHWGINFDMVLMTNLSHAHVEAHGGFEKYRAAKGRLFASLQRHRAKAFFPKKIAGVNLDNEDAGYFLQFPVDVKFGITLKHPTCTRVDQIFQAQETPDGFVIQNKKLRLRLPGQFNIYNALMAVAGAYYLGVTIEAATAALEDFAGVPGRMEDLLNNRGFKIFVDYGCEPASIRAALLAASRMPHQKLIHVFGSTGGHRDVAKRQIFGRASAEFADVSIITNDDVYDSDPQKIADDILAGMAQAGERRKVKTVETVLDRRQAIARALALAQPGDIVLITGKGSEQFLVLPGNKRIDWDDRQAVREELEKQELSRK